MNRRHLILALVSAASTVGLPLPAVAQAKSPEPSAAELLDALKSRASRGVGAAPSVLAPAPTIDAGARKVLDDLKQRALRGLSVTVEELKAIEPIVESSAYVDVEITFAFNSAEIKANSDTLLQSLATALMAPELGQSEILIAGHTDAKGRKAINKSISERRARAVRDALIKRHGIAAERLVAVGYGSEKLKTATDPFASVNRRVQIVNLVR